jgi:hypothetical protein
VVAAMKAQPEMIVALSSYTDCKGTKEYNLKLSQKRNQSIIDYVRQHIVKGDRIFGEGYGESTIEGNKSLDYLIVGGSFEAINKAQDHQKIFQALGFPTQIKKSVGNRYQVIVGQANTFAEAQQMVDTLSEKGHTVWINKCDCCKLTEEEHLQNRRTDFKIIRL